MCDSRILVRSTVQEIGQKETVKEVTISLLVVRSASIIVIVILFCRFHSPQRFTEMMMMMSESLCDASVPLNYLLLRPVILDCTHCHRFCDRLLLPFELSMI